MQADLQVNVYPTSKTSNSPGAQAIQLAGVIAQSAQVESHSSVQTPFESHLAHPIGQERHSPNVVLG